MTAVQEGRNDTMKTNGGGGGNEVQYHNLFTSKKDDINTLRTGHLNC